MKTGEGQHIDMSMLDVMVSMLTVVGTRYLMTGVIPHRNGTENPQRVPSAAFQCADGGYLQVVPNQRQWPSFCTLLGHADWAEDPRYATPTARVEHQDEMYPMVRAAFATRSVREWAAALDDLNIANSPINNIAQVLELPQIVHREMVQSFEAPNGVAMPALAIPGKLSASPIRISRRPPLLGEHTREVLVEIGRSREQIEALLRSGAVSEGEKGGSTVG
jgi:crotonobetainyl-CoA:carnitine CoA-transferase CaiB-like acyl-CoA transferase